MENIVERLIFLAKKNIDNGLGPFSAIISLNNKIISEGVNDEVLFDVSSHAEINAIKKAQQILKVNDLSEYTLWCSGHPCPMCLSAALFVNIKDIRYLESLEAASEVGLERSLHIYQYLNQNINLNVSIKKIESKDSIFNYYQIKSLK